MGARLVAIAAMLALGAALFLTTVHSSSVAQQATPESGPPVVIYLSTLFPADAPRAIVAAATPGP